MRGEEGAGSDVRLPLRYRKPGDNDSEAPAAESSSASASKARDQRWWRGSELYVRLFHALGGGVSAVVERLQQPFIDGDGADFDESPTMRDIRDKVWGRLSPFVSNPS